MKINVQVEGIDDVKQTLEQFGKDAQKILNKIIRKTANDYKKYVVRNYLSGQYLKRETGKTIESMITYRTKGEKSSYTIGSRIQMRNNVVGLANIYEHQGGIDIAPKKARVLCFPTAEGVAFTMRVHLESRPFMTDSSNNFDFEGKFEGYANQIIDDERQKRGFE
jgi:hypothetical protein